MHLEEVRTTRHLRVNRDGEYEGFLVLVTVSERVLDGVLPGPRIDESLLLGEGGSSGLLVVSECDARRDGEKTYAVRNPPVELEGWPIIKHPAGGDDYDLVRRGRLDHGLHPSVGLLRKITGVVLVLLRWRPVHLKVPVHEGVVCEGQGSQIRRLGESERMLTVFDAVLLEKRNLIRVVVPARSCESSGLQV